MRNRGESCKEPTCNKDAYCKGYCTKHYQQLRLKGKIVKKDYVFIGNFCKYIGCKDMVAAKGVCRNHYMKEYYASKR